MRDAPSWTPNPTWRKIGSLVVVALAAVLLTWAVVAAQNDTDVEGIKRGPPFANQGDLIIYTIEVTNQSDAPANVTLWDELPSGVTFESCAYRFGGWTTSLPCDPPKLWEWPVPAGEAVHTTLVVRVDAGTLVFPIINQAELTVDDVDVPLAAVTTIVNPVQVHLPLVARNVGR